ncbi:LysE family translocator [Hoeflea olei]|uniref:Threonine transporter RhtB n=1 Tax=Hoeflea olei TaxID=1480615 RepID=A0A1C1YZJ1_9HYPH|nr:LysE family translocator [Hoeflea olei]OCW58953.1 threonine transporter RhtB [Hoeflea olei]
MIFVPAASDLLTFVLASLLLALTPGPDMTLWLSRTLREGRASGLMTLAGTSLGIGVHTMLVAFGISALIVASPLAFVVLKTFGAAYLLWLAIQALRRGSGLTIDAGDVKAAAAGAGASLSRAFFAGLSINLLNPKIIIFFMTFLPQFVSVSDPHVTGKLIFLGVLFVFIGLPIGILVVLGAHGLSAWLRRKPQVMRVVDYVFAGVFSLFAVRILMAQAR